jgi:hypothetical protein
VAIAHVDQLDWYGGEQADQGDIHERTTVELPVTGAHTAAGPEPSVPPPAPIASTSSTPTTAVPVERRLTMLGGLLALVLLATLVGIIYFAMSTPPTVLAPGETTTAPAASPLASPAATAQATAAPAATAQATAAAMSAAATSAPATTAQATAAATSAAATAAPGARATSTP